MTISFAVTSRELRRLKVPHHLRREPLSTPQVASESDTSLSDVANLCIKHSALTPDTTARSAPTDVLRLSHHGFDSSQGHVNHVVRGRISGLEKLNKLLNVARDEDVIFHASGTFAILLRNPFGLPFVDRIQARLRAIVRLQGFLEALHRQKLQCEKISLSRIEFRYAQDLTAEIDFVEGRPIRFTVDRENPHRRMDVFLTNLLNDRNNGFAKFCLILPITLPLLRIFDVLERNTPPPSQPTSQSPPPPFVHPRNVDWYRLKYSNPPCSFDFRLRRSRDAIRWHLEDSTPNPGGNGPGAAAASRRPDQAQLPNAPQRDPNLVAALKKLFRSQGTDWIGLRTGIAAGVDGVEDAVTKLDEIVRSFANMNPVATMPDNAAVVESQPKGTGKKQSANGKVANQREIVVLD